MSDELQNKKRKTTSENGIETTVSESLPNLLVKRHSPNAKVPTRGSQLAAGYDLYRYTVSCSLRFDALDSSITLFFISAERKLIPAHGKALVNTQISIAVPPGTYGRVAPRSGLGTYNDGSFLFFLETQVSDHVALFLASKFMIDTGAGVIDADYRGIVFVLLYNLSDADFQGAYRATSRYDGHGRKYMNLPLFQLRKVIG